MAEEKPNTGQFVRREVPADLVEVVPENRGLFYWILASPLLLFIAWVWIDIFAHFSPISYYWIDAVLAILLFVGVAVLPCGAVAHYLVSSMPRLFGHAGWDVQPLEPVSEAEMYMVRYRYHSRHRAANSWEQVWMRAAQGWVYIEIATILVGAVAMIPIFFSVSDFGFGH